MSLIAARFMEASSRIAVRTATCLYSHNALSWQRLRAGKNELILLCIDIICDHVDLVRGAKQLTQHLNERRLAGANRPSDSDAERPVMTSVDPGLKMIWLSNYSHDRNNLVY